MNKIKKFLPAVLLTVFGLSLCAGFVMSADLVSADTSTDSLMAAGLIDPTDKPDAATDKGFKDAVKSFTNYFLGFLGLIAVIMVIYAGVLMVTAQGEEEQTTKGKKILIWAAIGLILIMLSYAIVAVIVGAGDAA